MSSQSMMRARSAPGGGRRVRAALTGRQGPGERQALRPARPRHALFVLQQESGSRLPRWLGCRGPVRAEGRAAQADDSPVGIGSDAGRDCHVPAGKALRGPPAPPSRSTCDTKGLVCRCPRAPLSARHAGFARVCRSHQGRCSRRARNSATAFGSIPVRFGHRPSSTRSRGWVAWCKLRLGRPSELRAAIRLKLLLRSPCLTGFLQPLQRSAEIVVEDPVVGLACMAEGNTRQVRNACVGNKDRSAQRGCAEIGLPIRVQPLLKQHQLHLWGVQFQRVV